MAFTTDEFADEVRLQAKLPDSGSYTDAEIFTFGDDVVLDRITPAIRAVRGEYLVVEDSVSLVADTSDYRINTRAISGTIRDVALLWDDGRELPLGEFTIDRSWQGQTSQTGDPTHYMVIGDKIRLFPTPGRVLTLRVRYERRPSRMVAVASCGVIQTIVDANTVDISPYPAGFPAQGASATFDIVQGVPNFDVLLLHSSGTHNAVTSGRIDFGASVNVTTAGATASQDYVALADTTPVIPVPTNAKGALVKLTAALILAADGDRQGAGLLEQQGTKALANFLSLIDPRNSGADQRIVPQYSPYGRIRVRM